MGKKVKTGKLRKDKFYQLAKESGYRSRAAFKLLQLNRKYHFLDKSRICVDLCAAPGGWLQVAAANMPMSSVIIGVDLVPIKSIANVITHAEDITSAKCRQLLKGDLSDNKADVILHDGAPNVGKNWLHDAYQQNILVLQSFKLATEFLKKGGWFITKVFRSKDYYSLLWVFQQFFKKVESTKPQASRNESAEIFVVCQHYLDPDTIDPKFLDIKYVFSDVNVEDRATADKAFAKQAVKQLLAQNLNKKSNREGYPDNDYTLYHRVNATEFINNEMFLEVLAQSNEIVLDDKRLANHPETTDELVQCFKDIKLLGKNDIKNILKWRLKMKKVLREKKAENGETNEEIKELNGKHETGKDNEESEDEGKESGDDDGEHKLNEEIEKCVEDERKSEKKKRRKLMKEKRKLRDKLALKMEFKDDTHDFHLQGDNAMFSLAKIKTKQQLLELQNALPDMKWSDDENEEDIENGLPIRRKRKAVYGRDKEDFDEFYKSIETAGDDDEEEGEDDVVIEEDKEDEHLASLENDDDDDGDENPLITDLVSKNKIEKKKAIANSWFNKTAFDFLKNDDEDLEFDENEELVDTLEDDEKEGKVGNIEKKEKKNETEVKNGQQKDDEDSDSDSDTDSEDDGVHKKKLKTENGTTGEGGGSAGEEKKREVLTPYELALGEMIVNSKKVKSMLIDETYNKYSGFGETDNLPKWFADDEKMHCTKVIPVPNEIIDKYKKKQDAINARPIKKVVEAKVRQKRRTQKRLDKARKKAENISENLDMSDKERQREIKQIYRKAGLLGKKKVEVKYVVAKKNSGKRGGVSGMKGPYRIVDKRLKKDKRFQKKNLTKNRKKSSRKQK